MIILYIKQDDNGIYSFQFEDQMIETPKTGDSSNIKLWIAILCISLACLWE